MNGKNLDLSTEAAAPQGGAAHAGRKFIGVRFDCCGSYARVYKNRAGDAYEGRCPKCLKPIRFEIGPGGSSARFFSAS